jgi:hypothetical protein
MIFKISEIEGGDYCPLFYCKNLIRKDVEIMMKEYETKDFYLGVLLLTEGFRLDHSIKRSEGVYFVFEILDDSKLRDTINDFLNYKATVNMRRFTSAITRLRKEIDKHK